MTTNTEIAPHSPDAAYNAAQMRANVNLIQEVMQAVMKKDTHYGVIPGTPKPSLWKPGAEKLLMTFRIASDTTIEDLSTGDEARYRVKRRGMTASGLFVGEGIGEASSNEEKYKWRRAVCDEEWAATPEDRRREKWGKGQDGKGYKTRQVRTNIADVANTILKMADKRAYVALALNVTAASDIFTQDIEDLPEGMESDEPKKDAPKAPVAKNALPAKPAGEKPDDTVEFIPRDVNVKSGEKDGKAWTKLAIQSPGGDWFSTFDTAAEVIAKEAMQKGEQLRIGYKTDGKYKNIVSIEKA